MKASDTLKERFSGVSNVLVEIANHLLINGSMVFFSGLSQGKLGISLFFFQYGRYTGNLLFHEYARHLIDLAKLQIHEDYPLDYERGLAGVGAGFDYLKKHGYFDVGDDWIHKIDSKIVKAIDYERRVDVLTGFGRYLRSRYEGNSTLKSSIIQLVDLITGRSNNETKDALSFLCDVYLLDIEKEKIEHCLSSSIDALIEDVQQEPISQKLFTLVKLSQFLPYNHCRRVIHEILQVIFTQRHYQFTDIHDLQWLLRCDYILKNTEYQSFILKIKKTISKNLSSLNLSKLDELFIKNHEFGFHGGYAGFGLSLMTVQSSDYISWTDLL